MCGRPLGMSTVSVQYLRYRYRSTGKICIGTEYTSSVPVFTGVLPINTDRKMGKMGTGTGIEYTRYGTVRFGIGTRNPVPNAHP
ncbi:hypothetical protein Hanom_Chr12g01092131 [Helianthus anomalus]